MIDLFAHTDHTTNPDFFYSNLFIAIITFIVGTSGLYLYYRRNQDYKKSVARIIRLEIENAEERLKEARKRVSEDPESLPEHLYAMPEDTWSKNKHLFVKNFKPNEWNSINEFYDFCQLYDEAIKHNDARFAEQEKEIRSNVHRATYKYVIGCSESLLKAKTDERKQKIMDDYFKKIRGTFNIFTDPNNILIYTANKQHQQVDGYLKGVDTTLSTSTVGSKLEKLGKRRFWIF
jgi:hypothetical protein